jgi:energy-coupling factor transporter ATP-binding protein EcfA2
LRRAAQEPPMAEDPRQKALLAEVASELFHTVEHQHDLWLPDPFDVPEIHADAREALGRRLQQAASSQGPAQGGLLLLLGESGSGKTHLLRVFRSMAHSEGLGYVGYLQAATSSADLPRTVLHRLIDSLQQPYAPPLMRSSGLRRLSDALASRASFHVGRTIERLGLKGSELSACIEKAAADISKREGFQDLDPDVVRALLYLQARTVPLQSRVHQILRCEALARRDRQALSAHAAAPAEVDPLGRIIELGRVIWACHRASLVLCVDQLEDLVHLDGAAARFGRLVQTLGRIADALPSALAVVSCLDAFYRVQRPGLPASAVQRLEADPGPIVLHAPRTREEVLRLVGVRLACLYETLEVPYAPEDPTLPFPPELLGGLAGLSTRHVLEECRRYRERLRGKAAAEQETGLLASLDRAWIDFQPPGGDAAPEREAELAGLLAWGAGSLARQLGAAEALSVRLLEGQHVAVDFGDAWPEKTLRRRGLLAAVCNRGYQRGALDRQVAAVLAAARDRRPVLVRSTPFPGQEHKARRARQMDKLGSQRGWRVIVEDAEWRRMAALRAFCEAHAEDAGLEAWLRSRRPLLTLPGLRDLLRLDPPSPGADRKAQR